MISKKFIQRKLNEGVINTLVDLAIFSTSIPLYIITHIGMYLGKEVAEIIESSQDECLKINDVVKRKACQKGTTEATSDSLKDVTAKCDSLFGDEAKKCLEKTLKYLHQIEQIKLKLES